MRHVHILNTGNHVPERVVANAEVDALIGEPTSSYPSIQPITNPGSAVSNNTLPLSSARA